jgi:hypothetical protein
MAENDLNPWQVMARRPAPLAKLVESENERLLAARTPASAEPLKEREPRRVPAVKPAPAPETSDAADEPG